MASTYEEKNEKNYGQDDANVISNISAITTIDRELLRKGVYQGTYNPKYRATAWFQLFISVHVIKESNKNTFIELIDNYREFKPILMKVKHKWDCAIERDVERASVCMSVRGLITRVNITRVISSKNKTQPTDIRSCLVCILKLIGATNQSVGYVQGMTDIGMYLILVFYSSRTAILKVNFEAVTFMFFTYLMSELGILFVESYDSDTKSGLLNFISKIKGILEIEEIDLLHILEKHELFSSGYLYNCILLLLSRDFTLQNTLFLWDKIFSHDQRFNFVVYLISAQLIILKSKIEQLSRAQLYRYLHQRDKCSPILLFSIADNLWTHNEPL